MQLMINEEEKGTALNTCIGNGAIDGEDASGAAGVA